MKRVFFALIFCFLWFGYGLLGAFAAEPSLQELRRLSEQGDLEAQYQLGLKYQKGNEVNRDLKEARKWWRKAAEKGHAKSQLILGSLYAQGYGVEKDIVEAEKWVRQAAEQGFAPAQYNLGVIYANSEGVIKSYVEAYKWYLIAGMNGADVNEVKRRIKNDMTQDQVAEGLKLAKAYVAEMKKK